MEVLMGRLIRSVTAGAICVVALTLSTGMSALAAGQNPTTGQPGAPTNTCSAANPVTPGNSANSPGSPFNVNVTKFYAGNTGSASLLHSNSGAAVSQYDVACVRLSH
jgi:hypothetical protein